MARVIQERLPEGMRTRAEMLVAALRALDQAGIAWCVVSGCALRGGIADELADAQDSAIRDDTALGVALAQCRLDPDDVDVIVSAEDFERMPRVLATLPGITIVRAWAYAATSTWYDLASFDGSGAPVFLCLDVSSEVRAFGTVLLRSKELLHGRRRLGQLLWVPRPPVQFIFSFLKQLHKAQSLRDAVFKSAHTLSLSNLYLADPPGTRQQLRRFFSERTAARIARAAEQRAWDWVLEHRQAVATELVRIRARTYPLGWLRYRVGECSRWRRRLSRPTGVMVVFLGLDGSGKSSVMARVLGDLADVFPNSRCYHQRPCVLWAGAEDPTVRGPAPMPRRNRPASLVKLALWGADYWAGFLFVIFPRLVQSALILFDRYYYDLLVDPDRYRYGGPTWAAQLMGRLIPRPDLVFLLDAPPEVSDARRRDGRFRSTDSLRASYSALVRRLRAGHIVDASRPIDEVTVEVERVILRFLGDRTARRAAGRR
jgi:thymidylate kinase